MRVLLIPPVHNYPNYPVPLSFSDFPTGFGYLAASLKKAGHTVYGCNLNNIQGYVNAYVMIQDLLPKRIKEVQPDLIGLGGLCVNYAFFKDAIGIIRNTTKAPIVMGGQIINNDAEDVVKLLKPDFAIVGEAENAIVTLANQLVETPGRPPSPVIINATIPDITSGAFPDYEPFGVSDMIDNYSQYTRLLYRSMRPYPRPYSIVASRSCPFNCTFCIHGHRPIPYRARTIPDIMEEIRVTYEKYHFNILILLDELFAVSKDRMNDFSNAVLAGKKLYGWDFDWMFQTHASAKLDIESLKLAKQAGCTSFSYGLESASPTVLKSMNKKINPEDVGKAIEMARDAKLGFSANLIFGDPAETIETVAESLSFWLKYSVGACIFLGFLTPYPGSGLFKYCQDKGLIKDKKEYYENINNLKINMTSMPDNQWTELTQMFSTLEANWTLVRRGITTRTEPDKDGFTKFWVKCQACGEESMYREHFAKPFWIGCSCLKCGQKIKVEVK